MPDIKHLKEQLARARRFSLLLTSAADRARLHALANEFERQINAATAAREMQQSIPEDQDAKETATSNGSAGRPLVEVWPMVSVDQYRHELRSRIDRAALNGATEILIDGDELCRTLRGDITAPDACSKAMRDELKHGDIVFIETGPGVGMTIRYLLPRKG
jgi:hypothetical protein